MYYNTIEFNYFRFTYRNKTLANNKKNNHATKHLLTIKPQFRYLSVSRIENRSCSEFGFKDVSIDLDNQLEGLVVQFVL